MPVHDALLLADQGVRGRRTVRGVGAGERERGDAVVELGREPGAAGQSQVGQESGRVGVLAVAEVDGQLVLGGADVVGEERGPAQPGAHLRRQGGGQPLFEQQGPPQPGHHRRARPGQCVGEPRDQRGTRGRQVSGEGGFRGRIW